MSVTAGGAPVETPGIDSESGVAVSTLPIGIVAGFVTLKLALHLVAVAVTPYSVHRDELLYLAMGKYLRFFAMDFPPFIAAAANTARFLFGDTLFAIRILPALAGAVLLLLCAFIVRELGGRRGAYTLALLAMLSAPLFLRSPALFQPVVFDQLWWTLAFLALLRIGRRGSRADWCLLGLAGGLGLLTKFSIGFVAAGLAVALVARAELEEILANLESAEPRLRRVATFEVDTRGPVDEVVATILERLAA